MVRLLVGLLLLATACAPTAAPREAAPSTEASAPRERSRVLVTAIRVEPASLASRQLQQAGATLTTTRRFFNANLVIFDERGNAQPYLAAELPQIQTDSWRTFPDGRMETTYRLKEHLVWHDGAPITAQDFVFASRVYGTPELGSAHTPPISLVDEVVAADPRTFTIHWKRPYAHAGILAETFPPLPSHILEAAFQSAAPEAFAAHAFWSIEYIGAGPFRLDRWQPGAFIEASAFDRHVLGAPKISRLRLIFLSDPNTALANLLAGEVHLSADDSIRFEQGLTLQREWGPTGGSVLVKPDLWRASYAQLRPELAGTPGLADVQVRKALAFTIDREGLDQALFDGKGIPSEVPLIPSTVDYYREIEPAAVKYRFDPAQAQTLLTRAGYARGADGVWASPTAGRLAFGLTTTASTQGERELSILAAGWREAGFEVSEYVFPVAQTQDGQARASFPGLFTFSTPLGEDTLAAVTTLNIPRPENRWFGNNRGGWSNPEFDRLSDAFSGSLDQRQRVQLIAQMVRIFSDEVPAIGLYFNPIPIAHVAALKGPGNVAPASAIAWNVHQWELR